VVFPKGEGQTERPLTEEKGDWKGGPDAKKERESVMSLKGKLEPRPDIYLDYTI